MLAKSKDRERSFSVLFVCIVFSFCFIAGTLRGGLLFWLIDGRTRKAGPEKALNGLFPAVAFPQKSESNERRNLKFFKILQMHFEHFGFVDRFEPAKCGNVYKVVV